MIFFYIINLLFFLNTESFFLKKNYVNNNILKRKFTKLLCDTNINDINEQPSILYETEVIKDNKPNKTQFYKFGLYPVLLPPNENGELTWYPIGIPSDFNSYIPRKITVRDINYSVWKDKNGTYYSLRDACSHQGASLSKGCINNNLIVCPYHGYKFDGSNGNLESIPYYETKCNENFNINSYKVIEKKGLVYMNTIPIRDNITKDLIDENKIWIEPEAYNNSFKEVILKKHFANYAKLVSVNSLDICHISFVHTFGNKNSPNPLNDPVIEKVNDNKYHFKITYKYKTGPNSIVSKFFNSNNLIVENEFILPHTTVARVKFGDYVSTIITNALPVSKYETRLYVKAYRNYWYSNPVDDMFSIINPFMYITNAIGNYITMNTMEKTLNEDKEIIDNIDKYDYESMHGKFSIKFDKLSNLYKHYYKRFYENGKYEI